MKSRHASKYNAGNRAITEYCADFKLRPQCASHELPPFARHFYSRVYGQTSSDIVFYIFYSQLACFALKDWQSLQVLPFRHEPPHRFFDNDIGVRGQKDTLYEIESGTGACRTKFRKRFSNFPHLTPNPPPHLSESCFQHHAPRRQR